MLGFALLSSAPTVAAAQSEGGVFRWFPSARMGLGAHVPINGPQSDSTGIAFDLRLGLLGVTRRDTSWFVNPEIGYAYDGGDRRGGHFFTAGAGLYRGNLLVVVGATLHGLVGDSHRAVSYGTRESLSIGLFATTLGLEVGHQWVRADLEDRHDLRIGAWFNPVPIVLAVVGLSIAAQAIGRGINTAVTHPGDLLVPASQRTPH